MNCCSEVTWNVTFPKCQNFAEAGFPCRGVILWKHLHKLKIQALEVNWNQAIYLTNVLKIGQVRTSDSKKRLSLGCTVKCRFPWLCQIYTVNCHQKEYLFCWEQSKHMLLFSNSLNVKALHFAISTISCLQWVGGRYSLWSAIGLSIALHIGRYSCDAMPRIALFASGM